MSRWPRCHYLSLLSHDRLIFKWKEWDQFTSNLHCAGLKDTSMPTSTNHFQAMWQWGKDKSNWWKMIQRVVVPILHVVSSGYEHLMLIPRRQHRSEPSRLGLLNTRLYTCRGARSRSVTSVPGMTLTHLMVGLQPRRSGECGVPLQCHFS